MKHIVVMLILLAALRGSVVYAATDPDSRVGGSHDRPCGYKSQFSSMQACLSAQRQCMDKWFWLNCDYSCENCWVPSTMTGLDPQLNPLYTIFLDEYSNATYNMVYAIGDMFKQLVADGYHCIIGGDNRTSKCFKTLANGAVVVVSVFYPPAGVAIFTAMVTYQGVQCVVTASNPSAPAAIVDRAAQACAQLAASGATVITIYAGGVAYTVARPSAGAAPPPSASAPEPGIVPSGGGSGSTGGMPKPPVVSEPVPVEPILSEPVAPPIRPRSGVAEPVPGGSPGYTIIEIDPASPKLIRLQDTVCKSIVETKCEMLPGEIVIKAIRRSNGDLWIYDGHHRWMAAQQCQHPKIKVEIMTEAQFLEHKGLAGEGITLEDFFAMLDLGPKPGPCRVVEEFIE